MHPSSRGRLQVAQLLACCPPPSNGCRPLFLTRGRVAAVSRAVTPVFWPRLALSACWWFLLGAGCCFDLPSSPRSLRPFSASLRVGRPFVLCASKLCHSSCVLLGCFTLSCHRPPRLGVTLSVAPELSFGGPCFCLFYGELANPCTAVLFPSCGVSRFGP